MIAAGPFGTRSGKWPEVRSWPVALHFLGKKVAEASDFSVVYKNYNFLSVCVCKADNTKKCQKPCVGTTTIHYGLVRTHVQ